MRGGLAHRAPVRDVVHALATAFLGLHGRLTTAASVQADGQELEGHMRATVRVTVRVGVAQSVVAAARSLRGEWRPGQGRAACTRQQQRKER